MAFLIFEEFRCSRPECEAKFARIDVDRSWNKLFGDFLIYQWKKG
jgi:hypothetical protein